jgi:hypothetical protein
MTRIKTTSWIIIVDPKRDLPATGPSMRRFLYDTLRAVAAETGGCLLLPFRIREVRERMYAACRAGTLKTKTDSWAHSARYHFPLAEGARVHRHGLPVQESPEAAERRGRSPVHAAPRGAP